MNQTQYLLKPTKSILYTHLLFLRYLKANQNIPLKHSKAKSELPTIFATSGKEDSPVLSAWWVTFLRRLLPVEPEYTERTKCDNTMQKMNLFLWQKYFTSFCLPFKFESVNSKLVVIIIITISMPLVTYFRSSYLTNVFNNAMNVP